MLRVTLVGLVAAGLVAVAGAPRCLEAAPEKQRDRREGRAGVPPETAGAAARPRTDLRKIREDSLLRRKKPARRPPDLRSSQEKWRDAQLVKHYTRVAQLDVMAALARKERDAALADRVEQIRRKEVRRFMTSMRRFLATTRGASSGLDP